MAKLVLSDVSNILGNPTSAQNTINSNSDAIESAIENTLSRDGSTPNQMEADLDLNNNDLLNVHSLDVDNLYIDGELITPTDVAVIPSDVMLKPDYDPQNINSDAFNLDNHTGTISSAQLETNSIITSKITDLNVTTAKIANDAIDNTKLSNMANSTVKGRNTAGTGDPEDLTMAQLIALLKIVGAYAKDNILATVSQSGGVPTGGVIERGSNGNGEYTKWADGTLECWNNNLLIKSSADGATGVKNVTWTFPAAFSAIPYIAHTISSSGPNSRGQTTATATTSSSVLYYNETAGIASDVFTRSFAKGRWF